MTAEPTASGNPDSSNPVRQPKSKAWVVKPGRLPVTEATYDKAGAASPFGDDITFPFPVDNLIYEHPPAE
jgi:succinate dehydrogenase / fumarate reductase, iron-sulfur subunit